MKSSIVAFVMLFAIAIAPTLQASGKKKIKTTISFHIQADATDNAKMIFPQLTNGKTLYFHRMPEITSKDISGFSPFPSDVGDGYGIVFKLKGNAANRFAATTNANIGRWLIAQVNGRVVDGVMIDKEVDDGFVVIWKGITLDDINLFDKDLKRIGADKPKKK